MDTTLKIISGTIIMIIIMIGYGFIFESATDDVADKLLAQITGSQLDEAYSKTHSAFQETTAFEEFNKLIQGYNDKNINLGAIKEYEWTGMGFKDDMRFIYGNFTFQSGTQEKMTWHFSKEKGELKLIKFEFGIPK